MTEAQRLWGIHQDIAEVVKGRPLSAMSKQAFEAALSDYSPWVTDREPTREDGDENHEVFVEFNNGVHAVIAVHRYRMFNVKRWMRIHK